MALLRWGSQTPQVESYFQFTKSFLHALRSFQGQGTATSPLSVIRLSGTPGARRSVGGSALRLAAEGAREVKARTSPLIESGKCSALAESGQGHLTTDPAVRKALNRIINSIELNPHTSEDLLQQALAYLWSREQQHPEQRLAWYLRGVKFHLKDIRRSGRSLDSAKRHAAQAEFADGHERWDQSRDAFALDEGIMSEVCARDVFSLLVVRLKPRDQFVLGALFEGLGVGEIANLLNVSHQSVLRCRERIGVLAIKLGVISPDA